MNEPLPPDIVDRVRQDFGDRAEVVVELLLACRRLGSSDYLSDRLVRCVIYAARGNEMSLQELIVMARQDYRDVISAAEYEGLRILHLRDFNRPFHDADIPEPPVEIQSQEAAKSASGSATLKGRSTWKGFTRLTRQYLGGILGGFGLGALVTRFLAKTQGDQILDTALFFIGPFVMIAVGAYLASSEQRRLYGERPISMKNTNSVR